MLFKAAGPDERYRVLERFYTLPDGLIARFYAGKSTLMNIIDGIIQPDSGEIRLNGQDLAGVERKGRRGVFSRRRPQRGSCRCVEHLAPQLRGRRTHRRLRPGQTHLQHAVVPQARRHRQWLTAPFVHPAQHVGLVELEAQRRLGHRPRQHLERDHTALLLQEFDRAFDADIAGMLAQAPEGTCLILVDIDHFKAFNDNYGHQLGDQVLKVVAKRLQEACRDGCKLYRFGGEEFAILVPKSQLRISRQLAEAMRRGLEKLSLKDRRKDQRVDNITASFGVAQWQEKQSVEQLIEKTDKLLYEAKRLGRNRVMPINS